MIDQLETVAGVDAAFNGLPATSWNAALTLGLNYFPFHEFVPTAVVKASYSAFGAGFGSHRAYLQLALGF